MAAPTPTARTAPTGIKLKDGFSTLYTFSRKPNVNLWEKTVTPPGVDGGDSIEQTTMFNTRWRTQAPRALLTLTESSFNAAYDPGVLTDIVEMINIEQTITARFPDGTTWAFFGYLKTFQPGENSEGAQPEASCTIVPTNFDPVGKVEAGPALASVTGT